MKTMNHANRITRKRTAKPETQWGPDDRVALGPAAEPVNPPAPFIADRCMVVAPGLKPGFFATEQEAREAAYDLACARPGQWFELYGRAPSQPGWTLWLLVGVPFIDTAVDGAASWITVVQVDPDSVLTE